MSASELDEDDLASEALAFVRSARAFIEWHEASGSVGFPRSEVRAKPTVQAEPALDGRGHAAPVERLPTPSPVEAPAPTREPPREDSHAAHSFESGHSFESARPADPKPVLVETPQNLPPEERVKRLAVVSGRVQACVACGLHAARGRTVFSRGSPSAELCFVGEGPGEEEDRQGLPFVGKAGQLLDKMILAMGFERDDVYICNVVKCRPPENRTPEPSEMATCLPFLNEQLDIVRPKAIVALGGTALKGLMGPSEGITKARGSWRLYRGQIPLMPTFHPAYILRQPTREVKAMVWSDLQQVLQRLGKKAPGRGAD